MSVSTLSLETPSKTKLIPSSTVDSSASSSTTSSLASLHEDNINLIEGIDEHSSLKSEAIKSVGTSNLKTGHEERTIGTKSLSDKFANLKAEWFVGVLSRQEAEDFLHLSGCTEGSFMVRESDSQPGSYALSILTSSPSVKHYRIHINSDSDKIYINKDNMFDSLSAMISYYRTNQGGLACRLNSPCNLYQRSQKASNMRQKQLTFPKEWEINWSSIELKTPLGRGHFGEVWSGFLNRCTPCAVKLGKKDSLTSTDFLHEAQVMRKLSHPNILTLYGICQKGKNNLPVIVTELLSNGNLLDYLRNKKDDISEHVLSDMAKGVAKGMEYMEKHNYIHRDLAARNVLVSEKHEVKIADFGMVLLNDGTDPPDNEDAPFAVKWLAPEVFQFGQFSSKSDIWSYAVFLNELYTFGQAPYPGQSKQEAKDAVLQGYRMPQPQLCPDQTYKLMLRCWEADPLMRPSFRTVVDTVYI